MARITEGAEQLKRVLDTLVAGIDVSENTDWEKETRDVSRNIRKALAEQMDGLRPQCDSRFLDYCNCVKSLLAVYNFGNLATVEELIAAGTAQSEVEKCRKDTESDKKLMKEGIRNIIEHVTLHGYDLTPYLNADDCIQILGNGNDMRVTIPVTLTAATVLTTLIYFRRACKRLGLYSNEELDDLGDTVSDTVAQILHMFAKFILSNGYMGWGFTLDPKQSIAVTLNDTYAVVDAISRFDDAVNQNDKIKRDQEFLDKVAKKGDELGFPDLIETCVNAIYRTAYNTYARDRERVYGRSVFYTEAYKRNQETVYSYNPISTEQIASSNRSSALFNPLYIAMITMYGYNEKELVIRRLMDDYALVKQYYKTYELKTEEKDGEKREVKIGQISAYAKSTLRWFKADFDTEVKLLLEEHAPVSYDYSDNERWKRYYNIARVFQKFIETHVPGDLMKIEEYRDYLNSTKDAIDQVQIAYRKFDDTQRLGIVDTDYVMFSSLDINADPVTISKLNKANISVNYLRPLLLSSKIMIVNALIKYPQADMESLYAAIKEAKHRKTVFKKRGEKGTTQFEWLWNEDTVDMNSTARHCEAIMYDYFDYFERYELSYKALNNLKKYYSSLFAKVKVSDDGTVDTDDLFADGNLNDFKRVVLNLTRKNVDEVQLIYTQKLREKDNQLEAAEVKRAQDAAAYEEKIANIKREYESKIAGLKKQHETELSEKKESYDIGNTVRGWIRAEADRHLQDMLSYMIINNINGYLEADGFCVDGLMHGANYDELADGQFSLAHEMSEKIMATYKRDKEEAEKKYADGFKAARRMQVLFEGALDDALKSSRISEFVWQKYMPLDVKNEEIRKAFEEERFIRRNSTEQKKETKPNDDGSDE